MAIRFHLVRALRCLLLFSLTVQGGPLLWTRVSRVIASSPLGGVVSSHGDRFETTSCSSVNPFEATIQEYLQTMQHQPSESKHKTGRFHVQGWRWHTLSLVRESKRLAHLAARLRAADETDGVIIAAGNDTPVVKAVDYVVDFNMKGLHRIESNLFFPWLRRTFQNIPNQNVSKAFAELLDRLEQDRSLVAQLGASLKEQAAAVVARSSATQDTRRHSAMEAVEKSATEISTKTREMMRLEDALIVPAVAALVSESEQKSFNSKVIRSLGILDSRMHLVGMYEAVWELNDEAERKLFQESIPSLPQMMIPRWKRLLYEPMTAVLDMGKVETTTGV